MVGRVTGLAMFSRLSSGAACVSTSPRTSGLPASRVQVLRRAAAALLALAGLVLFGQGLWIHAKAMLAQILLERAFAQSLASGQPVKPWSWARENADGSFTSRQSEGLRSPALRR